jgi:hypothetical protein
MLTIRIGTARHMRGSWWTLPIDRKAKPLGYRDAIFGNYSYTYDTTHTHTTSLVPRASIVCRGQQNAGRRAQIAGAFETSTSLENALESSGISVGSSQNSLQPKAASLCRRVTWKQISTVRSTALACGNLANQSIHSKISGRIGAIRPLPYLVRSTVVTPSWVTRWTMLPTYAGF